MIGDSALSRYDSKAVGSELCVCWARGALTVEGHDFR